jgi:hypothetical protein
MFSRILLFYQSVWELESLTVCRTVSHSSSHYVCTAVIYSLFRPKHQNVIFPSILLLPIHFILGRFLSFFPLRHCLFDLFLFHNKVIGTMWINRRTLYYLVFVLLARNILSLSLCVSLFITSFALLLKHAHCASYHRFNLQNMFLFQAPYFFRVRTFLPSLPTVWRIFMKLLLRTWLSRLHNL